MKGRWINLVLVYGIISTGVLFAAEQTLSLKVNPDKVLNRIDEKVYGHFLEHIYHSVHGGLWGDVIWNRSFEQNGYGQWVTMGDTIQQNSSGTNIRMTVGDSHWSDYEFTLEAKKTGGAEGFLILFRVKSENEFYWCNLGGWNNQQHGLERGLDNGNRWSVVGRQAAGHIQTGHWYKIKVRCEGMQFKVWLDDELVLDYTDDGRGAKTGAVGIGTWATQAMFRNLKVTSLDGKELYNDLPKTMAQQQIATYWKGYGDAKLYIDATNPLNSGYSQKIESNSNGGGLQQDHLSVKKGERYVGSIWARGTAKEGLIVSLIGENGNTVSKTVGVPGPYWQEYSFSLSPDFSSDEASIRVGVKGMATVWVDQISMMPKSWKENGGFRPDLLQAVKDLHPPVIRWPGGCFASSYQWKQGIGPQHKRIPHPREIWDDLDVYNYGTDEFIEMCRRVGAEPLIVVNIGSQAWNSDYDTHDYTQDVLDWIEYCNGPADSEWGRVRAQNGHPEPYNVKYWEIDNETWHTSAEDYAQQVLQIAPLMRQMDPSIELMACGSNGVSMTHRDGMPYNRTVIEKCASVLDYISIHYYENPNQYANGPYVYEQFFRGIGDIIAKCDNPKMKIYVSEWNAQSTDWRTGLYCGGLLNAFERCGDILEIGGPALFLRHVSATAWDNAFINFDQSSWFPAPNYQVMKLWQDHYAPERIELNGKTGPLNVVATRKANGKETIIKLVNPSDDTIKLSIAYPKNSRVEKANAQIIAADSLRQRNTLNNPQRIKAEPLEVTLNGSIVETTLPPLSAAVIVVK